jgi:hypothetical protein
VKTPWGTGSIVVCLNRQGRNSFAVGVRDRIIASKSDEKHIHWTHFTERKIISSETKGKAGRYSQAVGDKWGICNNLIIHGILFWGSEKKSFGGTYHRAPWMDEKEVVSTQGKPQARD